MFRLDLLDHFRDFWFLFFLKQYGCRITWPNFFLWTILSLNDPQNFSYWSDVAFYICNYDVITKAPMTSYKNHTFPMRSTCYMPSFNVFLGAVSEIPRYKFFPFFQHGCLIMWSMMSIMIKTFYMSSLVKHLWWKLCFNPTSGYREKHESSVQTNKRTQM